MSQDPNFSTPAAPSMVGEILDGRYRVTRKLGEGGMGEVYAADHVHIEKKFAIKLLKQEIVSNAEAVTRFRQEARSASSIGHRNIIAIEDFGQLPDGRIYMCMELLNGAPLNDLIETGLSHDRLLNIMIQTGHGLAAAHSKGIIHRDMKPENIFVTVGSGGEDVPKLLDFGIAKVAGGEGQNHLTRTGTIFGTPFYMAPEQALGNPVDARTDVYAMGVILYQIFAGSVPFGGESFMGILTQHITTEPEPVAARAAKAGRQLPAGIAEIVSYCMRKNPAERYQTMDDLVAALVASYRTVGGAGMSAYMEAFPVAAANQKSQPAIMPPSPTGSAQIAPHQVLPHAGQPTGSGAAYSQPAGALHPGQTGSSAFGNASSSLAASSYGDAGASQLIPPKKSKAGLIAVLFLLLAGGGGAAWYFLAGPGKKSDKGAGSGSDVALVGSGSDAGSGSAAVATGDGSGSGSGSGSALVAGIGSSDPGVGSGSQVAVEAPPDAAPPPIDSAPAPEVHHITVAVQKVKKFRILEGERVLAEVEDGSYDVEVVGDTPRELTLRASGFEDLDIKLGPGLPSEFKLVKKSGGTTIKNPNTGSNNTGSNTVIKPAGDVCAFGTPAFDHDKCCSRRPRPAGCDSE